LARGWIIGVGLAIGTWAIYGQVVGFEFVGWDDDLYIGPGLPVHDGLELENVLWAFRSSAAANWHPLTWLSHMLDFELYGDHAGGHHATSALLHTLNGLLLFGALRALTGAVWRSALVAALFAWHPLHVESVAWVAERKDVLSTAFALTELWSYAEYAERGQRRLLLLTLALFALGLMAKPMLVTLPCVLLLLDVWPLRRLRAGWLATESESDGIEGEARGREDAPDRAEPLSLRQLLVEKIPFFALSALSCGVTVIVQRAGGAMSSLEHVPLGLRLANGVAAYAHYLAKTLWPTDLTLLYPHPYIPGSGGAPLPGWQVAEAALLLLAISALVWVSRRRYAWVGWLWFLGMLVPVIGIVQVGGQALAERYSYVPAIGLFIVFAWGGGELATRLRARHAWATGCAAALVAVLLVACIHASRAQARHWRNSVALFEHAIEVNPRNRSILFNLGNELKRRGRTEEAVALYRRALAVKSNDVKVRNNLGLALASQGDRAGAMAQYERVLEIAPGFAESRANLANELRDLGRLDEAIEHYRRALADKPELAQAHNSFGSALRARGEAEEAELHYRRALELEPDYAEAHTNLGLALQTRGENAEALLHHREAVRLAPGLMAAHNNLALVLVATGDLDAAVQHYREALRLAPDVVKVRLNLARALESQGDRSAAAREYRGVLGLEPGHAEARGRLQALATPQAGS
jgi:tetratricopeptide (TPR) repeat protein